jgi:hypothetical protein
VRTRIGPWGGFKLKKLNLELWIGSFESESDVLRLHVRHAHVAGRESGVDYRDVILSEAKKSEEVDRRASICYRNRNMIRIEYHHHSASLAPHISAREPLASGSPLLRDYQLAPPHGRQGWLNVSLRRFVREVAGRDRKSPSDHDLRSTRAGTRKQC